MSLFVAQNLSYTAGESALVSNASFALEKGTLTALVGPNGAGKSTLLRLALGLLKPDAGHAEISGDKVSDLAPAERARQIAYLPQERPLAWPQPVRDIVALGRFSYGGAPLHLSQEDEDAVARAITACDLEGFEERAADTLSGGEIARVHLARALAGETPVLIADEPIAALDPRHAHEVLQLFKRLANEGRALLSVVHDLSLAARYADRLIWMKEGQIVADGTARDTITPDRLRDVFGVEARVDLTADGRVLLEILGPA
ncbi:iron ABC transporter ATP-binding protein [Erythrobacter longus]|uniref:Iron ABC transporter ATP-binding protein n=1 Tax=Erythrobacter longus TaxID=1044 RepID=A0A074MBR6_ERYLO|nr:ABC transporter ATP-binding protein [Erythrobacter longus]KEO92231.1 iron ABC transporter ATP-binding protein [Erythrobacter longus]